MLKRRHVLLGTLAVFTVGTAGPSLAVMPVIVAALAAIMALAVATGKAADALEAAFKKGEHLWDTVASASDHEAARRLLANNQAKLREEIGNREDVILSAHRALSANSLFMNSARTYLVTREHWSEVANAINIAVAALSETAAVFRDKAAWFPAAAQDGLAELPRLFESRLSILVQLKELAASEPPTKSEDVSEWAKLVDAYDQLRVQSLKLVRALDDYTRIGNLTLPK
jgi:hypothetical protein